MCQSETWFAVYESSISLAEMPWRPKCRDNPPPCKKWGGVVVLFIFIILQKTTESGGFIKPGLNQWIARAPGDSIMVKFVRPTKIFCTAFAVQIEIWDLIPYLTAVRTLLYILVHGIQYSRVQCVTWSWHWFWRSWDCTVASRTAYTGTIAIHCSGEEALTGERRLRQKCRPWANTWISTVLYR